MDRRAGHRARRGGEGRGGFSDFLGLFSLFPLLVLSSIFSSPTLCFLFIFFPRRACDEGSWWGRRREARLSDGMMLYQKERWCVGKE